MFRVLLLILLFVPHLLFANSEPKAWREAAEPFHLAGPIYYVGTKGLAVYLIKSSKGLIMLGGAMPKSEGLIVSSIEKLGFKLSEIRLLLSPHAHVDHVGTLSALKKMTGAKVAVMEDDVELLKSGGKLDYLFSDRPDLHFDGVTADQILKDGEVVKLGDVAMIAHRTAGHTRGCTTWEIEIEEAGKKYQVLFVDGTGINDGTRFKVNPSYKNIEQDYEQTFSFLSSKKPDIFLSYHTEFFNFEGKRARMPKEGFRVWIDRSGYESNISKKQEGFKKMVRSEAKK